MSLMEQVNALEYISPLSFANAKLRTHYPTLLKSAGYLLLEYLNINDMALQLYGKSYGLTIAVIIAEIQQSHIGKIFDVDYLIALTSTMKALLYQYSSSVDDFTVDSNPQLRFRPSASNP